jgi:hypothetical protein
VAITPSSNIEFRFDLHDLGSGDIEDARAIRDVSFPYSPIVLLSTDLEWVGFIEVPVEPYPPLISGTLMKLFGAYINNYSDLCTHFGSAWIQLKATDFEPYFTATLVVGEEGGADDPSEDPFLADNVIQYARDKLDFVASGPSLVVPVGLPIELLRNRALGNVSASKRHHVFDVNVNHGASTSLVNLFFDTGCTITTLFHRPSTLVLADGTYQLHLLHVPGGDRLCMRRLDKIRIGVTGYAMRDVDAITVALDSKIIHALFREVNRDNISAGKVPILTQLDSLPSFKRWIEGSWTEPPEDVASVFQEFSLAGGRSKPQDGLLGMNYLESIKFLSKPAGPDEEKTTELKLKDV